MPNYIYDHLETPDHHDRGAKLVPKAGILRKDGDHVKMLSHSWREEVILRQISFWIAEHVKETRNRIPLLKFSVAWNDEYGNGCHINPSGDGVHVWWEAVAVDVNFMYK